MCPTNVEHVVHNTIPLPDGGVTDAGCVQRCGFINVTYCSVIPTPEGFDIDCRGDEIAWATGRRPEGLVPSNGPPLARAAELEAASVAAFRRLANELRWHGAPSHLIRTALRSADDEVRHALLFGRLAQLRLRVPPTPRALRSLEEIAIENVREGCTREAFGAAVAQLQAHRHRDPRVRAAMAAIHPDEERHAELAFAVDRWIRPRLENAARRRVAAERKRALEQLCVEMPRLIPLIDALAAVSAA
jgi:hypothetical protein